MLLSICSLLIIYYHLYIYWCINCSKIFVWWEDLIDFKLFPVLFTIVIMIYNIISILFNCFNFLKYLGFVIIFLCLLNILYWLFTILALRLLIIQYSFYIIIHIILIFLIENKNKLCYDQKVHLVE